jgi:ribosome biogenesis GTPase A
MFLLLFSKARVGGDVYLIGTTNVGKSSIFNLLLDSDLCSIKAIDKVEKALTSPVPGTTLNLLKFPIMRPGKYIITLLFTSV